MSKIERDALPENLQGTYDDLNDFIEEYVTHHVCIKKHQEKIERLTEEIEPRITLIIDWLKENSNMTVYDEFMTKLWESKPGCGVQPDDKG